ncbi:MAG: DUF3810 domain-containing protein [Lachnospiraceae bacterium]|nr:DUF3810 domain-containing protein [Lachnospiraceae bacterium]
MLFNKMRNHIPIMIILLAVLLNIIARLSVRFSDFYVARIYPLIVETYGRLMSIFPFSVGEIMIYSAFLGILILFLMGFICLFIKKRDTLILRIYPLYAKTCLWLAAIFFFIMTANCFILFHCSPINEFYPIGSQHREYGIDEITKLRNYVVENANKLAKELTRDQMGYLVYEGEMNRQAKIEMQRLSKEYGRLSGFYPRPKPLLFSNFFSQQHMMGYFFPFSMEANYNAKMYIANTPYTIAHELAHVKGFIYEDEANFIAFLACSGSEDAFFRYSAYLGILNYVERDFAAAIANNAETYREQPRVNALVRRDNIFLTAAAWKQVEKNAVFNTDLVRNISNEFLEASLTLNGVSDGTLSYGRVVALLLMYYDGVLY